MRRLSTAKKPKGDRTDPKQNKSLAIRTVLAKMPKAQSHGAGHAGDAVVVFITNMAFRIDYC